MMLVVDNVGGEWIGTGLLFFIGAAFLLVYLSNRTRTWAALVAFVLFVLSLMPLMALTSRPELAGIVVLTAIGLPFLVVYLTSRERWWALIPAGVLLTSAVVAGITLVPGLPGPGYDNHIPGALELAGIAATFAIIWLRHHQNWAMIVALVGICLSAGVLITGRTFEIYAPLLVIAAGMFLLYRAIFVKQKQPVQ